MSERKRLLQDIPKYAQAELEFVESPSINEPEIACDE